MAFASRKSRMRAPHHRRTEEIGACLADPFANGEGRSEFDTFTIPEGRRRRVYRPRRKLWRKAGRSVNPKTMIVQLAAATHSFRFALGRLARVFDRRPLPRTDATVREGTIHAPMT